VAVRLGELDEPRTEGQLRVRAPRAELVWLAHEHERWRPLASCSSHSRVESFRMTAQIRAIAGPALVYERCSPVARALTAAASSSPRGIVITSGA
jgi:hypothetical protein